MKKVGPFEKKPLVAQLPRLEERQKVAQVGKPLPVKKHKTGRAVKRQKTAWFGEMQVQPRFREGKDGDSGWEVVGSEVEGVGRCVACKGAWG
ncbi:hypothetical protein L1987_03787 [Smallanthus sonchifolius]|uniref:Uncharacterized protein n=1 Tax=Smallanthus sonchifolius TaxID=185202 RepID=A0ACB9KBS3_9ASTR|nr:hypothetical protein L1987_03787 [Smallanthus sonchifolius]